VYTRIMAVISVGAETICLCSDSSFDFQKKTVKSKLNKKTMVEILKPRAGKKFNKVLMIYASLYSTVRSTVM
jgi:hypothetical protein